MVAPCWSTPIADAPRVVPESMLTSPVGKTSSSIVSVASAARTAGIATFRSQCQVGSSTKNQKGLTQSRSDSICKGLLEHRVSLEGRWLRSCWAMNGGLQSFIGFKHKASAIWALCGRGLHPHLDDRGSDRRNITIQHFLYQRL